MMGTGESRLPWVKGTSWTEFYWHPEVSTNSFLQVYLCGRWKSGIKLSNYSGDRHGLV